MLVFAPLLIGMVSVSTDLTFVRHAETLANATGKYSSKTIDSFSDRGKKQIDSLTAYLLKQPKFDVIYVSPSPRAVKTILPYLKATKQHAWVNPLLYECCTGKRTTSMPSTFAWGTRYRLTPGTTDYLYFNKGWDRLPDVKDYASGLAQVKQSVTWFRGGCAGQRVLLVGHSGHGGQFLHYLTGKWIKIENAKPIALKIQT